MTYTKHEFQSGAKLYASQLNEMDAQIYNNTETVQGLERALEQATIEPAESVEWLNANGDTGKKYYLPDGYIYVYSQKAVTVKHEANTKNSAGLDNIANGSTVGTLNNKIGMYTIDAVEVDGSWADCKVNLSGLTKLECVFYDALWIYYFDADGKSLGNTSAYSLGINKLEAPLPLPVTVDVSLGAASGSGALMFPKTKYIRMSFGIKTSSIDVSDIENLSVNFERKNYDDLVWCWYSTGIQHSNDKATQQNTADIADLKERTTAVEDEVADLREIVENGVLTNEPTGEVLIAVGDSITYGTGMGTTKEECNAKAWPTHLIDIMGYDATNSKNLGISGIGYCTTASGKTVRTVVDETDFSVADIVTVAVGINDWKNQSAKMDDFFSEMAYCLGKIRGDNPYCRIVYILPFNCKLGSFDTFYALGFKASSDNSDCFGNTLQTFVNRMKAKFDEDTMKALGIDVFDMTKSPITRYNIDTALIGGDDGIHPTAETHKVLAKEIARRIANT